MCYSASYMLVCFAAKPIYDYVARHRAEISSAASAVAAAAPFQTDPIRFDPIRSGPIQERYPLSGKGNRLAVLIGLLQTNKLPLLPLRVRGGTAQSFQHLPSLLSRPKNHLPLRSLVSQSAAY